MQQFIIDQTNNNQRLDKCVSAAVSISRSQSQLLIDQNKVRVNDKPRDQSYRVKINDVVTVDMEERDELFYRTYTAAHAIPILHEDEDILVIDKPSGIAVHPVGIPRGDTVIESLRSSGKKLFSYDEKRTGVVHRLDKETSGVMLLAVSKRGYVNLVEQFKKRRIRKWYCAVVEGIINQAEQRIVHALKRKKHRVNTMAVDVYGEKKAITDIRVMERLTAKDETFVLLRPLTGRTHQLRVHLAHGSHPVIGDKKYNSHHEFPRLFLHAYRIVLKHPSKKDILTFTAPLPTDLKEYLIKSGIQKPDRVIDRYCAEMTHDEEGSLDAGA